MSVWPNKALLSLQNSLNNMLKIFFLLFIIYAKVALYKNSLNWTFQAVWAVVFCCYYLLPIISVNKLSSWAPPPPKKWWFSAKLLYCCHPQCWCCSRKSHCVQFLVCQDWQPPFACDVRNFRFTPRVQRLNELEVSLTKTPGVPGFALIKNMKNIQKENMYFRKFLF